MKKKFGWNKFRTDLATDEAYAKSVSLKLAEEAEDAEAEAERHALNLLNFDWSGE